MLRSMVSPVAWAILASIFTTTSLAAPLGGSSPLVQTSSGVIKGHNATLRSDVWEFLGIPYGQAPVGQLRWSPPVKAGLSKTQVFGDHFAYDCPNRVLPIHNAEKLSPGARNLVEAFAGTKANFSEDCLALNIWVKPDREDGSRLRPVLVWLGMGGDSSNPLYNGKVLADEEDMIVVTVNYRSHIFGFPGAPGTEVNLGAEDARLAIEWVRDNIKQFKGDPDLITLAGHSVGADIVEYYSFKWAADPLLKGYVTLSLSNGDRFNEIIKNQTEIARTDNQELFSRHFVDASLCAGPDPREAVTSSGNKGVIYECRAKWYNASEKLGCGGKEKGTSTLDCMRKIDFRQILAAVPGKPFGAAFDIFDKGEEFGVTMEETMLSRYFGQTAPKASLLPRLSSYVTRPATVDQFLRNPAKASTEDIPATVSLREGCAESVYRLLDQARAGNVQVKKQDVWYYAWDAPFPNLQIDSDRKVYHGSDIPVLFGTSEAISGQRDDFGEIVQGRFLRKIMADFAKSQGQGVDKTLTGAKLGDPQTDSISTAYAATDPGVVAVRNNETTQTTREIPRMLQRCSEYISLDAIAFFFAKGVGR